MNDSVIKILETAMEDSISKTGNLPARIIILQDAITDAIKTHRTEIDEAYNDGWIDGERTGYDTGTLHGCP